MIFTDYPNGSKLFKNLLRPTPPHTHILVQKSPIYIPCCQLYNIYASLPGGLEDSQAMLYLMVTYLLNPLSFIPSLLSPYCSSVNLFGYRYCHFRLLRLLVPSFHYSLSFHISHLGNCIIMVYFWKQCKGPSNWLKQHCRKFCSITLLIFKIVDKVACESFFP